MVEEEEELSFAGDEFPKPKSASPPEETGDVDSFNRAKTLSIERKTEKKLSILYIHLKSYLVHNRCLNECHAS